MSRSGSRSVAEYTKFQGHKGYEHLHNSKMKKMKKQSKTYDCKTAALPHVPLYIKAAPILSGLHNVPLHQVRTASLEGYLYKPKGKSTLCNSSLQYSDGTG